MSAPSPPPPGVTQEVIAYVESEIASLKSPGRCYASVAFAGSGLGIALLGYVLGAPVAWLGFGVAILSAGATLVGQFCGPNAAPNKSQ